MYWIKGTSAAGQTIVRHLKKRGDGLEMLFLKEGRKAGTGAQKKLRRPRGVRVVSHYLSPSYLSSLLRWMATACSLISWEKAIYAEEYVPCPASSSSGSRTRVNVRFPPLNICKKTGRQWSQAVCLVRICLFSSASSLLLLLGRSLLPFNNINRLRTRRILNRQIVVREQLLHTETEMTLCCRQFTPGSIWASIG